MHWRGEGMHATHENPRGKNDMKPRYAIVSPVRDEADHIAKTLGSLVSQTVLPVEWVIVNDGSTDRTGEIIDAFAVQYPWIRPVHRENRGFRKSGGGVMEAFYDGYERLGVREWDFLVKLDGDLSFAPDYFERCFGEFERNPRLGIGGGGIYHEIDGRVEIEKTPLFHVRGATKIYRRACWDDIGGLIKAPGWDTLDEVKANMKHWETLSFNELKVMHHRYTGGADGGWKNAVKNGLGAHISGYHPMFIFFKSILWTTRKPYFLCSIGLLYGYIRGYLNRVERVDDPALIQYIRREQIKRLLLKDSMWK